MLLLVNRKIHAGSNERSKEACKTTVEGQDMLQTRPKRILQLSFRVRTDNNSDQAAEEEPTKPTIPYYKPRLRMATTYCSP